MRRTEPTRSDLLAHVNAARVREDRYRVAAYRAIALLDDINSGAIGWTTRDVDAVLESLRAAVCNRCRKGEAHK